MKKELITSIGVIDEKAKKYELNTLSANLGKLVSGIEGYRLKVLFVGGFSAGKSALINTFIGRELLEEGQRPETAIASELVYDAQEYIEAMKDGKSDRYSIDDRGSIDKNSYDYLVWHVDCPQLAELGDCTIVDMPGFNSGISDHNKAILRYAENGSAYIFVIDCEDGTIRKSISDFITEIKNYDSNMAIVVSKTDIKPPQEVEQVKRNIAETAESMFGEDVVVSTASKYYEDKTRDNLTALLGRFDGDGICCQEYTPLVKDAASNCISAMELYKKSLSFDAEELDKEIERHAKAEKELERRFEKESSKLEKRLKNNTGPCEKISVNSTTVIKNDIVERLEKQPLIFLQYTINTVICQASSTVSLLEWSVAQWNQADFQQLAQPSLSGYMISSSPRTLPQFLSGIVHFFAIS